MDLQSLPSRKKPKAFSNMSNETNDWSYCKLIITCQKHKDMTQMSELDELKKTLVDDDDNSPISFFQIVPIPQELIDNCYKIGDDIEDINNRMTGYRYLHEFTKIEWGTPYDADDAKIDYQDDEMLAYSFRTFNGEPSRLIQELSAEYPYLTFDLEVTNEMDLFEAFTATYEDGEQIEFHFHKKQP